MPTPNWRDAAERDAGAETRRFDGLRLAHRPRKSPPSDWEVNLTLLFAPDPVIDSPGEPKMLIHALATPKPVVTRHLRLVGPRRSAVKKTEAKVRFTSLPDFGL